jgi:hypothetical protein
LDVKEGVWAFGMAGELDLLPTVEVAVDLLFEVDDLQFEVLDSGADIDVALSLDGLYLFELIVETFEWLLKLKVNHKLLINRP